MKTYSLVTILILVLFLFSTLGCYERSFCGDELCNDNENYQNCPEDCSNTNTIFDTWYSVPEPGTQYYSWKITETNLTLTNLEDNSTIILDVNYYDDQTISFTGAFDIQYDYNIEEISTDEKILHIYNQFNYQKLINQPKEEIRDYEYCGNLNCGANETSEICLADCGTIPINIFMENGSNKDQINLLFVFNKYSDPSLIESDLEKFVDKFADHNGLFAYSPLKENINEFNVYYTDFNLNCYPTGNTQHGSGENCVNRANHIARMTNSRIVITILDFDGIEMLGLGGSNRVLMSRVAGPVSEKTLATKMLVHEFGHAFANLSDEYSNTMATMDLSNRPNVDITGCPTWCSGDLNTQVPRFEDFNNFITCAKNITNNFEDYYQEDPYTGACGAIPSQYSFDETNIGVNCIDETGCYWNAKGITNYRSSQNSLMRFWETSNEFNRISREAIQSKIDELTR